MAILVYKNNTPEYLSASGAVTDEQKKKALDLHEELKSSIAALETNFYKAGIVYKEGIKNDALRVWYRIGKLLNHIAKKYGILGTTDEIYFWPAIYNYVSKNIQKKSPPKNYRDLYRNHFKRCSILANYNWITVKRVGTWAEWRDLLDNKTLLIDERVLKWTIKKIIKLHIGHKEFRPFLHNLRRGVKRYNTGIFDDQELEKLLNRIALNFENEENNLR